MNIEFLVLASFFAFVLGYLVRIITNGQKKILKQLEEIQSELEKLKRIQGLL